MTRPTNAELRELLGKSSGTPWDVPEPHPRFGYAVWCKGMCVARLGHAEFDGTNALLIVSAVNSLEALIAENEEMREALAALVKRCSLVSQEVGLTAEESRAVSEARALVEKSNAKT